MCGTHLSVGKGLCHDYGRHGHDRGHDDGRGRDRDDDRHNGSGHGHGDDGRDHVVMMFAMIVVMGIFVFHIFTHLNLLGAYIGQLTIITKHILLLIHFKSTTLMGFKSYLLNMF